MRFLFVVPVGLEVAACSGSSNGNAIDPDGGVPGTHERDAEDVGPDDAFWQAIQVDGNWVEFYPTITELALGSDIVAYGSFVSVRPGTDVQGDAPEDLVRQPVFAVEGEVWKGAARDAIVEVGVVERKAAWGARENAPFRASTCLYPNERMTEAIGSSMGTVCGPPHRVRLSMPPSIHFHPMRTSMAKRSRSSPR
jgi:hypothetical protein